MKIVKHLLLASAVGVIVAPQVQAADLPSKKEAPAEYVKVCSAFGEGFFYIPGSDTCLKITGFVRADYEWANSGKTGVWSNFVTFRQTKQTGAPTFTQSSRSINQSGYFVRAQPSFDVRTMTEYGTLRGYISSRIDTGSGSNPEGNSRTITLYRGFVQWAGLTAGRAQSMFDFYADSLGYDDVRGPDQTVNLLAYTATFGNGFSATLSLEDTDQTSGVGTPAIGSVAVAKGRGTLTSWGFQGTRQPDVVAVVGVDQSWGSAQLSGIYHSQNVEASTGVDAPHKNSASWGVNGGVRLKLPMIAPGDELWLQATYFKGDLGRQTQGYLRGWGGSTNTNNWQLPDYDAVVVNGSVKLPTSWVALVAFQHNWSAQWASHVEASYINVTYPGAAKIPAVSSILGATNWNEWRVGVGTDWMPVKNLMIGLELYYTRLDQKAPLLANGRPFTGAGGVPFKKNLNGYESVLRVQRNF